MEDDMVFRPSNQINGVNYNLSAILFFDLPPASYISIVPPLCHVTTIAAPAILDNVPRTPAPLSQHGRTACPPPFGNLYRRLSADAIGFLHPFPAYTVST